MSAERNRSRFGFKRDYVGATVAGLNDVNVRDIVDMNLLQWDDSEEEWVASAAAGLPAPLQSIANLSTSGSELIYTTASDVYATTGVSGAGRSFVAATTAPDQQALIQLVPGTDVQEHSSNLDNLNTIGAGAADNIVYTTGAGFSNTTLTPFVRTDVLTATSSNDLASSLGYVEAGTVSTTNRIVRVSGTNTVTETGASIDASDNVTGVNDLTVDNDLVVTGNIDNITPSERSQLENINGTTISAPQWGYLGNMDQDVTTTSTPTFAGLNASSQLISGVLDPVGGQDAATKSYVDTVAATGSSPLEVVQLATTGVLPSTPAYASPAETITSTGGPGSLTIDSVVVSVGDRILVKDQGTDTENGVYDVTDDGATPGPNYVLTRSSDFNQAAMPILAGASVFVEINPSATTNTGTSWSLQTTVNDVDPLTDSVTWVQIGGLQSYSAGNGIDSTALGTSTIQTDISARLKYTGTSLDLNTISVAYGGTGNTTLASGNVLVGQGTSAIDVSKTAPTGDFVGTSDTQTLTNKTLTNSNNDVTARSLFSNSGANTVSTFAAANPTAGQVLTATSAIAATWQTPSTAAFEPDRVLFVYPSATDVRPNWSTVAGAIADATALTPTASNHVLVVVYPGTYSESIPITIPEYVTVSGNTSTQSAVIIRPTAPAPSSAVFITAGNARMHGIIIDGFDGASNYATIGLHCTGGTSFTIDLLNACTARNCSTAGIRVTGDGSTQFGRILICKNVSSQVTASFPFSTNAGFEVEQAGLLSGVDLNASGFLSGGGFMLKGFYVHDDFSFVDVNVIQASSCTDGLVVGGGTTSISSKEYPSLRVSVCKIGLISQSCIDVLSKAYLYTNSMIIDDDTGIFPSQTDLKITSPALPANPNVVILQDSVVDGGRLDILNGATNNPTEISGMLFSPTIGELQTFSLANTVIGYPYAGRELVVGEGNSHIFGMMVLRDDGGVFTDITDSVKGVDRSPLSTDVSTTASIDLTSAPATIDGVTPTSGVTRVLVKDGSSANPGTDSVDNGIYLWNGTGAAMTRTSDFPTGGAFDHYTYFRVDEGTVNYGSLWKVDASTLPASTVIVGTTSFGVESNSAPAFPSTPSNNDALYIGSQGTLPLKFLGIKIFLSKPITLTSGTLSNTIINEYWNGSAWVTLPLMSTHSDTPYDSFANDTYGYDDATVGNPDPVAFQYRYGDIPDWATTTVDGTSGYWVRTRIVTAANIDQIPIIEQIKLHSNRTEINKDGYLEFFGAARPTRKINITSAMIYEPGNIGFTNPANQRLVPATDMTALILNGQMNDGQNTSQVFILEMDNAIDTSEIIQFKVVFAPEVDIATGDLQIRVDYAFTKDGDTIGVPGGTPTATLRSTGNETVTVNSTATSTPQISHIFDLDITALNPLRDTLWLQFVRNGGSGSDTFGGQIYVFSTTLIYKVWSSGGHEFD